MALVNIQSNQDLTCLDVICLIVLQYTCEWQACTCTSHIFASVICSIWELNTLTIEQLSYTYLYVCMYERMFLLMYYVRTYLIIVTYLTNIFVLSWVWTSIHTYLKRLISKYDTLRTYHKLPRQILLPKGDKTGKKSQS